MVVYYTVEQKGSCVLCSSLQFSEPTPKVQPKPTNTQQAYTAFVRLLYSILAVH